MRLAIFYTGDIRHNTNVTYENHNLLFEKIKEIIPYEVYYFTRNDPERGICPYDPPTEQHDPDNVYRRGQGGAVQVWDFLRGVQRTTEKYVMRLRTDVWFLVNSNRFCHCIDDSHAWIQAAVWVLKDHLNSFA